MSEPTQIGPYDTIKCHFCGKSAKDGPEHTAGFERRERFATVGAWFPACGDCAKKPYEQPKQFQEDASEQAESEPSAAVS